MKNVWFDYFEKVKFFIDENKNRPVTHSKNSTRKISLLLDNSNYKLK